MTTVEQGLGALQTARGNLPLESVEAAVSITGLVGKVLLTQAFHNPHEVPLEATYIFPLPDRAAVTAMRMTADGRVIEAELKERGRAREEYDQAIAEGKRASIAEEERPDVFTMRVGNILPGEQVSVALSIVGPLSYEAGEATFRLPLVVAPRYIPGTPLQGASVGEGYALDTDAVPDASRITPPVLLPGFPNPVRLAIEVDIDPAGLPLGEVTSSLHAVTAEGNHLSIQPGERADRDFVLRLAYGQADAATQSLSLRPDTDGAEGTFRLTVLPPTTALPPRPRDVVLLLDRSGSMQGWKMVAARRAAARIVDTLTAADRFAVLAFDHVVEHPPSLPDALVPATDRNRYLAVEHLARVDARGGTELLAPLMQALKLLSDGDTRRGDTKNADTKNGDTKNGDTKNGDANNGDTKAADQGDSKGKARAKADGADGRQPALVLVTDGQVGNEDQILAQAVGELRDIRVHTVGIDRAVNAGFLGRLAAAGGGRCELVESEDRLDDAMDRIHRRIGAPVVTGLALTTSDISIVDGTVTPSRLPDLYPGVPLVVTGRYEAGTKPTMVLAGQARDGSAWSTHTAGLPTQDDALTATWARAHLRDLEDRYVTGGATDQRDTLERRITETSLRFGVLCRFTAWLAVDTRVAADGSTLHRVIQPVEPVSGWEGETAPAMMLSAFTVAGLTADPSPPTMGYLMAAPPYLGARSDQLGALPERNRRSTGGSRSAAAEQAAARPAAGAPTAGARAGRGKADERNDVPQVIRTQAAVEADRLRAAQDAPEYERRELLADLGTRLDALIREAPAVAGRDPIRALLAELQADRPLAVPAEVFEQLWTRTLRLLDELAGSAQPGSTQSRSTAFWKRGGSPS
jgi:Ca-activated chloride channel family protein